MGPLRPTPPDERCLAPEDLTAFAAGELTEGRRAEVSRHLLRCPSCRLAREETAGVIGALRAFGTTPGWAGDLEGAKAALRGERRSRQRASIAGLAAAAVLVTGLALAPRPSLRMENPRPVAERGAARPEDPAAEEALLRAQEPDGRWSAATAGNDEAATGLALLALVSDRPQALRSAPVARAVADGVRWLRARQGDDGGFGGRDAPRARGHALATEALLAVWAATGDRGLHAALVPAVQRLGTDARRDADNEWTQRALARARALGWHTPVDVAPGRDPETWTIPGAPDATLCARVLAVIAR